LLLVSQAIAYSTSFSYYHAFLCCFSHISHLFSSSLTFVSCITLIYLLPLFQSLLESLSIDSLTSFHCFLHLFQLFLISSRLLFTFAHLSPTSLSVTSRISLLLIAFPSCASGTSFTCFSQFNPSLLTRSFIFPTFNS
jgi:hypothetical protein